MNSAAAAARFRGIPRSVAEARRFVAGALVPAHADLCDLAVLIVSELASNAVLHGLTDYTVALEEAGGGVRITVRDEGAGRPAVRTPGLTEIHGRGLQIVSQMSDAWGVLPAESGIGKAVWFEIRDRRP